MSYPCEGTITSVTTDDDGKLQGEEAPCPESAVGFAENLREYVSTNELGNEIKTYSRTKVRFWCEQHLQSGTVFHGEGVTSQHPVRAIADYQP